MVLFVLIACWWLYYIFIDVNKIMVLIDFKERKFCRTLTVYLYAADIMCFAKLFCLFSVAKLFFLDNTYSIMQFSKTTGIVFAKFAIKGTINMHLNSGLLRNTKVRFIQGYK